MRRNEAPVESVTAASYVIPTDAPEADGTLAWDATTLIVVTATAAGQRGTGWSYGSPASALLAGGLLTDIVRGRDALDAPAASEAMSRAVRNIGREGVASIAISAVDIALWDLKPRLLGVPLATGSGLNRAGLRPVETRRLQESRPHREMIGGTFVARRGGRQLMPDPHTLAEPPADGGHDGPASPPRR